MGTREDVRGLRRHRTAVVAAARQRLHWRLSHGAPEWVRRRSPPCACSPGWWRAAHPCSCSCGKRKHGSPRVGRGTCYQYLARPALVARQRGHRWERAAVRQLAGGVDALDLERP